MKKFNFILLFFAYSFCLGQNKIDTTILYSESTIINGEKYFGYSKTNDTLYVENSKGKIIFKQESYYAFEFVDFNGDSLDDIVIHYMGNTPEVQDLYLFDFAKKNFVFVNNLSDFPAPIKIQGTKYYYSYHKSGCADMNWGSDLFYIDNFKTILIGNISGRQCNDRDKKDGVYISKISKQNKVLLQTLPTSILAKYTDYKWGFIAEYWKKNYKKFIE